MTVPHDVVVAAAYQMNQLEHRPHNYDIGKAIERAILSERERHADVVAAAAYGVFDEAGNRDFRRVGRSDGREGKDAKRHAGGEVHGEP